MQEFVENHLIKCNKPSASQQTLTCSKLTMETWCENMFKVNNKDTRMKLMASFGFFIVNFEHEIAGYVICILF